MSKAREISELGDVVTVDGDNVSIGTTASLGNLTVGDGLTGTKTIALNGSGSSTSAMNLDFRGGGTGNPAGRIGYSSSDEALTFHTGDFASIAERMRIDSSGNVGIGTISPTNPLHVEQSALTGWQYYSREGTTNFGMGIGSDAAYNNNYFGLNCAGVQVDNTATAQELRFVNRSPAGFITFKTGLASSPAERVRIDGSGNLLVSKTSAGLNQGIGSALQADGQIDATADNRTVLFLDRRTGDGELVNFRKNGTTVGSIVAYSGSTSIVGNNYGIFFNSNIIAPVNSTGLVRVDNLMDIGQSAYRFNDAYIANGVTTGSDGTAKQQIASLTDAEMQAAKALSKLFKTFKWNDAVERKGDAARKHTGVIAQDVRQTLIDHGLDPSDYAFFMSNTWWETQTEVPAVEAAEAQDAVYDEEGNLISEAVEAVEAQEAYTRTDIYETLEEAPEGATERTRLGIRYPELLSFIGAATEQRLASIEARLDALETV